MILIVWVKVKVSIVITEIYRLFCWFIDSETVVTSSHVHLIFAFSAFAVLVSDPFARIFHLTGVHFCRDFLFNRALLPKNTDDSAVGFTTFLRPASCSLTNANFARNGLYEIYVENIVF